MTETETNGKPKPTRNRRRCLIIGGVILFLIFLLFIIILVLALTVFKTKEPQVKLISASLDGISPRLSFPVIHVELNISLNLNLEVHNPNYGSLKHGDGKSFLFYREIMVGEADLYPGNIPARGSSRLDCKLTLEVDQFAGELANLIKDLLAGEIVLQTRTRIPGRVNFLGILKKHVVASSDCSFTVAIPAFKILSKECKTKTKF